MSYLDIEGIQKELAELKELQAKAIYAVAMLANKKNAMQDKGYTFECKVRYFIIIEEASYNETIMARFL